jgi:hypothetical protein
MDYDYLSYITKLKRKTLITNVMQFFVFRKKGKNPVGGPRGYVDPLYRAPQIKATSFDSDLRPTE